MKEFFIIANSFAAPFISDTSRTYQEAKNAHEALHIFVDKYSHPAGLYSAQVYKSADDYHKGKKFLHEYISNQESFIRSKTKNKSTYSLIGHGDGKIEIDGTEYTVENVRGGKIT